MKEKSFSEIMNDITDTLSRAKLHEGTMTKLALLFAMLQTRYDLDAANGSNGKGYISVNDLKKAGFTASDVMEFFTRLSFRLRFGKVCRG